MYEEIFKSYDIRGIVPDTLNKDIAYKIGRAFVRKIKCKKIFIGHDMRISSEELKNALIDGITDEGCDVIDLGLVSTDMTYYASGQYNMPSIMITASHNPKQYNGLKFCDSGAMALSYDSGLKEIKEMLEKEELRKDKLDNRDYDSTNKKKGKKENKEIIDEYIEKLLSFIDKRKIRDMKIAVDAANGMAGKLIPALQKKLPQLKVIPLFFELDGTFPNHPANPIEEENIKKLIETVKKEKADLGLAFDGDADRVFLVDNKGKAVSGSITAAMVSKAILKKNPGSKIIYSIVCSWILPETIKKYRGIGIETKVGHSIIKPIMRKENAIFGGESSGHYYFRDLFYADSGLLASLYIMQLISEQKQKLSDALKEFRKYYAIPETNMPVKNKDIVLTEIAKKFRNSKGVLSYKDYDGIRVDFKEWWFSVRASNTEPLLRLNLEAKTKRIMNKKKQEIIKLIQKFNK